MNSRVGNEQLGGGRLWLVVALCCMAVAVTLLARIGGLETWVYDSFQRYQSQTASDQILLVTVDPANAAEDATWTAAGFSSLIKRLSSYKPGVIAATQPLRLPTVPPTEQIAALAELEKQALRSGQGASEVERLSTQVAGFRKNYDAQQELASALENAGNVVLSVYAGDFSDGEAGAGGCRMHAVNQQGTEADALASLRSKRRLIMPPAGICAASRGIGFNTYAPEADGTVRRTNLIVDADGILLPSLPLAVLAARTGTNQNIVVAADNALTLNDKIFRTIAGFEVLPRFYADKGEQAAFESISATDVMAGKLDPAKAAGRIVLVGDGSAHVTSNFNTPVADSMPQLNVTAHNVSNLLQVDYLLRPDWLPWLEYGLLAAVLLLMLLWVPGMPAIAVAPVGLVLATLILSIEAWFLVSERIWVQFGTAALFAAIAIWVTHALRTLPQLNRAPNTTAQTQSASQPTAKSREAELDLEFSVLRQQPLTDANKEKMYEIAFRHGRAEEFAKAERVLRFIHQHDPEFKDVARLLSKLTGRSEYTPLKPAPTEKPQDTASKIGGRTLGRYEIEGKLGEGAMATVYLGRDPHIGRKVAIKTVKLAEEFDDTKLEEARLQFRREAESAGRLNHPNIIAIYDAGEDGDVSYLAMEYFEGVALLKHAQPDDLLPASWVLELMARAADALDYAHRQNVVHRDIKPANILYHAATDELKLTDFGIARLTDNSRTKTGIILGTPSYMSPEQLTASGVTGQSDLYSLGITLYQLLTGVAPFRADSIPKLMDKIMREPHRPVKEVRSDLPDCVDEILSMALAKDPEDRFSSGRAMAMALRDCAKQFGSYS